MISIAKLHQDRDEVAWLLARVEQLEAALRVTKRRHVSNCSSRVYPERPYVCDCGVGDHNAAIDAALQGEQP